MSMDISDHERSQLAQQFIDALPQGKALALKILRVSRGEVDMEMPYDEKLVGDPGTGVIHGGAVSTLMDTCCGAAVMAHPKSGHATATIGLRLDYMRPARPGQAIVARATCHRITRSVAFVRAEAFDDDADAPVATATGTFTVETPS